jgi:hypothetical protein
MQVNHILEAANQRIGNCGGAYSISQLNSVLTSINENYVDGTMDNGFLSCTPPTQPKMVMPEVEGKDDLFAFPNPTNGDLTVRTTFANAGQVTIELFDVSGRRVMQVAAFSANAGEERMLDVNLYDLQSGTYFLRLQRTGSQITRPIILAH